MKKSMIYLLGAGIFLALTLYAAITNGTIGVLIAVCFSMLMAFMALGESV